MITASSHAYEGSSAFLKLIRPKKFAKNGDKVRALRCGEADIASAIVMAVLVGEAANALKRKFFANVNNLIKAWERETYSFVLS